MAIATLAGAIFMACRTVVFIRRSVITTGTIKDFETTSWIVLDGSDAHGRAKSEHGQYARFEFRTEDGALVQALSSVGEWPTRLSAGDSVRVRYARRDPKLAEIDAWWRLWGAALALGLDRPRGLGRCILGPGRRRWVGPVR